MLIIIGFIIAISCLVFIHEFGHYYVAKSFGVKIEEFSIGFGKELVSVIDKENVKWKICAIPLGGFVKMYGDKDPISITKTEVTEKNKAFYAKPLYARFLIVAAGPLANYLFAILILAGFYFTFGKFELPAVISEVVKDSPASIAGLAAGDKVIEADGNRINDFKDFQRIIMINPNKSINLLIERDTEIIKLEVIPEYKILNENQPQTKTGYIGIIVKQQPSYINMGIFSSSFEAVTEVVNISWLTLKTLGQMLIGNRSIEQVGGIITIAKESGKSLSQGPLDFALFLAMLSINLGLINLLPIPVLDGGHLVLLTYEAIAKRPPSLYVQNILVRIGVGIIIFLIVISLSNDIRSLI